MPTPPPPPCQATGEPGGAAAPLPGAGGSGSCRCWRVGRPAPPCRGPLCISAPVVGIESRTDTSTLVTLLGEFETTPSALAFHALSLDFLGACVLLSSPFAFCFPALASDPFFFYFFLSLFFFCFDFSLPLLGFPIVPPASGMS